MSLPKDAVQQGGVLECDEPETSWPRSQRIPHNNAVVDLTELLEMTSQALYFEDVTNEFHKTEAR